MKRANCPNCNGSVHVCEEDVRCPWCGAHLTETDGALVLAKAPPILTRAEIVKRDEAIREAAR